MYFMGIDLGTSSVKIILMDGEGKIVASSTKEFPIYYPYPNWAEQNPEEWWISTKEGIREILDNTGIKGEDVKSIGLSGQMHGLVMLDKNNNVLDPAILWCDQRTQRECDYLNIEYGRDKLSDYTGNIALTGFTLPKILWIRNNKRQIYDQIAHILLPKDYIRFKLTGEYATDFSDASGMLLLDVKNKRWSYELLKYLNIDEKILPKLYESFECTGYVTKEAAGDTGLLKGTMVVAGAGDQAAAAIGTGVVSGGNASVSLGTSGVVFAALDDFAVDAENRLHSFCHANGKWHVMGVMLSAAASLKWWVEGINSKEESYDYLMEEAEKAAIGSQKLIFLPYLMGERTPYSDPDVRGSFIGLSMTHEKGHMTRAILEGVAYGLKDSLRLIDELGINIDCVRLNGGGAKSRLWRQIIADVFNKKVEIINSTEGPALGAAILASVGYGHYTSVESACEQIIGVTDVIYPIEDNVKEYEKYYEVYKKLYQRLKPTFDELSLIK
ncbi:Xylulose kinase [Caloramator mitchellensis]|uniref:Xylulose kinase n=1 Tax=Caloramator mitchellensis TaxID=908809 RepID=A0A0R3K1V0_CALMK|nr:xylulokinase [Caloramator mitchellensis]KRQ86271.1 Xylulose kinase [Caloramator mitchellensis]